MPAFDIERHLPVTPAECEVLRLLAKGHHHDLIAQELAVSVDAIDSRFTRFRARHGFEHDSNTAAWAGRHFVCCLGGDETP